MGTSLKGGFSLDGGGQSTLWKSRTGRGVAVAPELSNADAYDISGKGDIVGSFVSGQPWAYWYSDGKATGITENVAFSSISQISESGVAILHMSMLGRPDAAVYRASSATNWVELPLPAGTSIPGVNGISANGRNIVGHVKHDGGSHAVLWEDGEPRLLDTPDGLEIAGAEAVNDSGTAVGYLNFDRPAVKWSATGVRSELPGITGHRTWVSAINNAGTVVGGASKGESNSAVVWLGNTVHNLNDLVAQRSGYTLSWASDINESGQIVGTARLTNGTECGFIATPSTADTIYTTPGHHWFNNRDWKTACEPYSQTTRCRTEIIATQVHYSKGTYSRVTDWAFNNLTYTPSSRDLWQDNPLGNTGEWTGQDGRKWRTECDTANTGKNGCRSYTFARVADATPKPGGGYTYTVQNQWVFNNIVKFN